MTAYFCQRVTIFLTFLTLFGCTDSALKKLSDDAVILAFGDSLTAGVGTSRDKSYPAVLEKLSGLTVINKGISGEVTDQGLARLPKVIRETNPDLMILIEGGNDILRNKSYQQIEANLDAMITLAQQENIQIVLLGVPEKKLFSSAAPFYQQLADKHNLVYDNNLISDLLHTRSLKSDPIHFNAQGYQKMAEGIYQLLQQRGAL